MSHRCRSYLKPLFEEHDLSTDCLETFTDLQHEYPYLVTDTFIAPYVNEVAKHSKAKRRAAAAKTMDNELLRRFKKMTEQVIFFLLTNIL